MESIGRKHLPPISMLHGFAAVARTGSISRAAEQTGLTQSAVSRQIATLENWVGTSLFERVGRSVALNPAGRSYFAEIEPALTQIVRATGRLMSTAQGRIVELATLPSFGMRWLAPRLSRLSELHPDLMVNISARSEEFDFAADPFDMAIHVGFADWPGVRHDFLFSEHVVPVIAPALAAEHSVREPIDFLKVPLLVQSRRRDAWQRWFGLASVACEEPIPHTSVAHFLMLAQAVASGAGAALLPTFLIQPELEAGSLITPVELPLVEDRSYYLVYPEEHLRNPAVRELRDFIYEEAHMTVVRHGSEPASRPAVATRREPAQKLRR